MLASVREILDAPRAREAAGIMLAGLALLVAVALASYSPQDPSLFVVTSERPSNWVGPTGAEASALMFESFGLAAWFAPLLLVAASLRRLKPGGPSALRRSAVIGLSVAGIFTAVLLSLLIGRIGFRGAPLYAGGMFGKLIGDLLVAAVSNVGAIIVAFTCLTAGLALVARSSIADSTAAAARQVGAVSGKLRGLAPRRARLRELLARARTLPRLRWPHPWRRLAAWRSKFAVAKTAPATTDEPAIAGAAPAAGPGLLPKRRLAFARRKAAEAELETDGDTEAPQAPEPAGDKAHLAGPRARKPVQATLPVDLPPPAAAKLPPLSLLADPPPQQTVNKQELLAIARQIESRCAEFAVEGQVLEIHPGPVVTTFEFRPNAGIKLVRITALADDLALALEAESVRIERIPGRPTVGIEVPNRLRQKIGLREVLESDHFRRSTDILTLGLGKAQEGDVFCASLGKMPHLLIAGSTGAGKSVGLNSIITSLLYRARPDEVKFILIDPKMLELGVYENIPHLLVPVVTDMKLAANALKWAVREMERRYRLLASCNVRHLDGFNRLVDENRDAVVRAIETIPHRATRDKYEAKRLPYVMIVVDELADLLMTTGQETEEAIARLAQKARAVGIHLVLATQRPSVDILTGAIKANFPARIAFRCASKIDSRTILDASGAERLLGAGDMLYRPPGSARLQRVHGAYISEEECLNIVQWLRSQARTEFDASVLEDPQDNGEGEGGESGGDVSSDPMYRAAVRLVVATGQASTSFLQRKMRLGYSRAARIVDEMEAQGIVGPADGARPRQVLVDASFLERMDQQDDERA